MTRGATATRGVTDIDRRAQADRSDRRARRRRRVVRLALLALPLAALGWVLLGSSWLAVDRVQVLGATRLSEQQVAQAAAVAPGTPLARVDTAAVQARLARLAPVRSVRVSRSWPGTLRVEVVERVPAAYLLDGSAVRLLDADGVAFADVPRAPEGVVRLQVTDPGPQDPATLAALAVHRDLPADLRARVRIVRAATAGSVVLLTADGKQVLWGGPGDTQVKAGAALALLGTDSGVIDVSTPGVAVRD